RIEITPRQIAQRSIDRFSSVQPEITRPGNRTPTSILLENENHVVQQIPRLQIEQERWVSMLFENDRCSDRSFKTVGFVSFDQLAKRFQRAAVVLAIVR